MDRMHKKRRRNNIIQEFWKTYRRLKGLKKDHGKYFGTGIKYKRKSNDKDKNENLAERTCLMKLNGQDLKITNENK